MVKKNPYNLMSLDNLILVIDDLLISCIASYMIRGQPWPSG